MTPNELMIARLRIGAALRAKRQQANISQIKLSQLSGIHRKTIIGIEKGVASYNIDSMLIYENALKQIAI